MSLRWKTSLIIGVTLVAITSILYGCLRWVLLDSFARLERQEMIEDTRRARQTLAAEIDGLLAIASDWARWDETYEFIRTPDPAYVRANLSAHTLANLNLDLMLFIQRDGRAVYGQAFDPATGEAIPLGAGLLARLAGTPLLGHESEPEGAVAGLISLAEGPLLVAAHPILTSELQGPAPGTLVTGRFLDQAAMVRISEIIGLPSTLQPLDGPQLPAGLLGSLREDGVLVRPLDGQTVAGYVLLPDIDGRPAFVLSLEAPRTTYAQGLVASRYLLFALLIVDVAFGLVVLVVLLEWAVLSPMARLSAQVARVGASNDLSARMPETGTRELDRLAKAINDMLEALQRSRGERQQAHEEMLESVQLLRNVVEGSPIGIWAADRDLRVTLWNAPLEAMSDLRRDQVMGQAVLALFPALDPSHIEPALRWVLETGEPQALYECAFGALAPLRKARYLNLWANPLYDAQGKVSGIVSAVEDITNRKRAEILQAASYRIARAAGEHSSLESLLQYVHHELAALVDASNFYIAFPDLERNRLRFAYLVDEHVDKVDQDARSRELRHGLTEYVLRMGRALLATGEEIEALVAEGQVELIGQMPAVWLGAPLRHDEKVIGVIAMQSYTDRDAYTNDDLELLRFVSGQVAAAIVRWHVEENLARERDLLQVLMDAVPDTIYFKDTQSRFTRINRAQAALLGVSDPAAAIGKTDADFLPADQARAAYADEQEMIRSGKPLLDKVEQIQGADGKLRWFSSTKVPLRDAGGRINGLVGITRDITRRREVEELAAQQAAAIQASIDGIAVLDGQGKYTYLNQAYAEVYGYNSPQELLGRSWRTLYPPPEVQRVERDILPVVRVHRRWRGEGIGLRSDGSTFPQEVSLTALGGGGVVGVVHDISERKRLQAQFLQAQKMEAVGQLAGGVAHDFNNLLTAISGYATFAHQALPSGSEVRNDISQILAASERAANLTRQLLAFSRRQIIAPRMTDLNKVIASMGKMLRRLISEDIELVAIPSARLGLAKVDPGQTEQVLLNLVVNARDAMPEGGRLTIETANVELDAEYARRHVSVIPGDYIMVAVSDTGHGMSEETQERIFEPFYTTKEPGKGTGLGLATCYGIVKQSGGHIWLYSEPGKGTTFKIYFPRVDVPLKRAESGDEAGPGYAGSAHTILLVEDEAPVRSFAARVLRGAGYTALEAGNGVEALAVAGDYGGPIDLLVTDVVMPQMGGKELSERIREKHPLIKVLYISGYTASSIVHQGVLDEGVDFLHKPFTLSALTRKVREMLELGVSGRLDGG